MKTTPFQMTIIGLFGLAAFAAVGVLSGVIKLPKSAQENISGPVVVWGTIDQKSFQFTENSLKLSHKNISFSYVQKSQVNFESLLSEAIASGKGPDIIIISQEQILRNKSKIAVQRIDAQTTLSYKNAYINGAELFITDEGLVAIPFAVNPLVMFYNDRLLTSAGFAKPPQFWDEMQSYVDVLTVKNDDKDIRRSAVALGTFENMEYPVDILSALILQTGNKIVDSVVRYDNQNNALTTYQSFFASNNSAQVFDFFNAFSNPQKKLYSWNKSLPDDLEAFTSELTTFWFGYPTDESRIMAKNPNLNYKITSIPQIKNSKNRSTYGKIYGVAVLKSSPNRAAANIIQSALSRGVAQQITIADSNLQYPYRTTPESAITNDKTVLYAKQAIQTVGYYMPSFDFVYSLFNSTLNQIASGALDANRGTQKIEAELNNYIGKNQL